MSIFMPMVNRENFCIFCRLRCHALYASPKQLRIGKLSVDNFAMGGGLLYWLFMRIQLSHTFKDIISLDNLLRGWNGFLKGKRNKKDVQVFDRNLFDNLYDLHADLASHTYQHGAYKAFAIADPKPRNIHKATVRDRVLHHAIYLILYPFFDRTFVHYSYSCRKDKGTHKAIEQFKKYSTKLSNNNTKICYVLKCDIRKFFASIDQNILLGILSLSIPDVDIMRLLKEIINSFHANEAGKGLPLGNLTSQLFVNIYMNEFDHYAKHGLHAKQYVRYADDFVLLSHDRAWLEKQIPKIEYFLNGVLCLNLHPDKVYIRSLVSGVDFLGWVNFPDHRVLRSATSRRMQKQIAENPKEETVQSYLGLLRHGNTERLTKDVLNLYGLFREKNSE
ncbi:MAG: hypothetical protein A3E36_04840 [Candidatus Andersenbacteria bacterium RIFCSPHIGHO2_12_FULL_45_11b]|uniref:Reverse transcriptase domain-containing protein n=1 Tax=Candidatus Andersenbacteria bacterium RIFCSPHIGHO2_12_FULL_45_11b TaxID=1797282 RepID=A0A1G1XCB7_9BACT|nr:MAG: hypothetical protein A3E36_04840 [Candidatus Andersenbacteria bacterium RIFCSPHIGHO2_12_FULL_45_11b]